MINDHDLPNEFTESEEKQSKQNKSAVYLRPGKLINQIELSLHTYNAQSLFTGNKQEYRIGLIRFAQLVASLYTAAKADDPYADWFLLRIYDELIKIKRELTACIDNLESELKLYPIVVEPIVSEKPIVIKVWFGTQYGYVAAALIAAFDKLVRLSLTVERIGLTLSQSHTSLAQTWFKKIVTALNLVKDWHPLSIKRVDVTNQSEVAIEAKEKMGELPVSVLTKQLRSPFAPEIEESHQNNAFIKDRVPNE